MMLCRRQQLLIKVINFEDCTALFDLALFLTINSYFACRENL